MPRNDFRSARLVPALLAACAVGSACLPGARPPAARPPDAAVRGRLSLDAAPAGAQAADAGPLRVVFGAPEGDTTEAPEPAIVFSKPMRALGAGPHEPPPPVVMTPEAPGRWQWVGSSALRFNASAPLPRATRFRVEVPAGTRALDGTALEAPYTLVFATPRPALSSTEPAAGAERVAPDTPITLWFDQPVEAAEIQRAVKIRAPGPVGFTVAKIEDGRVDLRPAAPLPRNVQVRVRVDASLRAATGELPMGRDAEVAFRTIAPLSVVSWRCAPHPYEASACDPDDREIKLVLSNPVVAEQLRDAIQVEPAPGDFDVSGWSEDPEYTLTGGFEAGTTYRIRVRAKRGSARLADMYEQPLAADVVHTVRFGDEHPRVVFGADGTYWMSPGPRILPVNVINVVDPVVSAAPLSGAEVLARLAAGASTPRGADEGEPPREPDTGGPADRGVALAIGKRNEGRWTDVKLDDLLPAGAKGPVVVRARYGVAGDKARWARSREVQLTDLGPITRLGHDNAAVWVTELATGKPVRDASVELHRVIAGAPPPARPLAFARTDGAGFAALAFAPLPDGDAAARVAVFVRRGGGSDEWAYQALAAPRAPAPVGFLFDERGIYRPGESVQLKGMFRVPTSAGLTTPAGREVAITVEGPEGRKVAEGKVKLSVFGTFAFTARLGADVPLGRYRAHATLAGGAARSWFSVDEYRPPEFKAHAALDRPAYVRGDPLVCTARGEYLYGGRMAGAGVSVSVTRSTGYFSIPGLDGFTIQDDDARVAQSALAQGTAKLDGAGAWKLPVTLAMPGQTSAEEVTCSVEVQDLNRQAQEAGDSAVVHPGEVYVALGTPPHWQLPSGAPLSPRVLAVTPQGKRRAMPVRIELIKRTRSDQGAAQDVSAGQCDVTTGAAPVGCALAVPSIGQDDSAELVVRASTKDGRGNVIAASWVRSIEPPPRAPPPPRPPPPPAQPPPPDLELSLATTSYKVGDTARLTIRSPFAAPSQALLTVEREGILDRKMVTLPPRASRAATVEIPITRAMLPNARFSVTAVAGTESMHRSRDIEVDPAPRRLNVTVSPSTERAAPGDTVEIDVFVADASGKPARAEVTLWAADEASLMLARYSLPDPFRVMLSPRDIDVEHADARDSILRTWHSRHRTKPPQVRMGATSVSGRRGDFRQTVVFLPDLVTDASGHVRRRVKLPDGLTAYRFMAVAVAADDRFGAHQTFVVTSKPLMARPSLPRVIRAGDRFEASVVVSTLDLPPGDVSVTARAQGLTAAGPARRVVRLDGERPAEARFPFRADRAGKVRFTFDAAAPGAPGQPTDGVALAREVVAPMLPETAAIHGETAAAVAEALGDLSGVRDDVGGLSIALSATPLAGLADGIEQLLTYPYGCVEQTVSRMVPLLSLRDLAQSLGVALPAGGPASPGRPGAAAPPRGELGVTLTRAVERILAAQRPDGGFGLWPGSGASDPWVTAYALWGLGEARRHGLVVPRPAVDRALARLDKEFAALTPETTTPEALATAAFVADLRAAEGALDAARADALYANRARMPPFAQALLLHAITAGRPDPERIRDLTGSLENVVRIDGAFARAAVSGGRLDSVLDSDARTSAMILRALVAANPDHPLAARLALGLVADRRGGAWRSTQETAWALLGLDAYRKAQPPPAAELGARVFLGDALVGEATFEPSALFRQTRLDVPMGKVFGARGKPLTFAVEGNGKGKLHYEARLRFVRKEMPRDPVEAGFFVQKTMIPLGAFGGAGSLAGATRFAAGQLVLCEIDVVTPSPRRFVVIEDPLPGGLEGDTFAVAERASWLQGRAEGPTSGREMRDDRVVFFVDALPAGLTRYRYLARATTVGTFQAPPTRVEEMYVPETFGRTAGGTVVVAAP